MAVIIIADIGPAIRIETDGKPRNIHKTAIVEISIVKNTIIKIDIGGGALHNVFLPYAEITVPTSTDIAELRETLTQMLQGATGTATEARQIEEIGLLNQIADRMSVIEEGVFDEPLLSDHSGPNVIYKGFAIAGSLPNEPKWAIQRIKHEADIDVITWAEGNKDFDKIWNDRETLIYS